MFRSNNIMLPVIGAAVAAIAFYAYAECKKSRKSGSKDVDDDATVPTVVEKEVAVPEAKALLATPPAPTGNKSVLVLISSYQTNPNLKSNQDRAMTILKGLKIPDHQLETIDGAAPANKERRNELFGISGIRAKYPQFFVVDQTDTTTFVADWDNFEAMNEMGTLKETLNLAL